MEVICRWFSWWKKIENLIPTQADINTICLDLHLALILDSIVIVGNFLMTFNISPEKKEEQLQQTQDHSQHENELEIIDGKYLKHTHTQ